LLYLTNDRKLMALEVNAGATFEPGLPKALFDIRIRGAFGGRTIYAVSRDGQRFLTSDIFESSTPSPITVVLNWTADLKR
jgi:hypothetical protein